MVSRRRVALRRIRGLARELERRLKRAARQNPALRRNYHRLAGYRHRVSLKAAGLRAKLGGEARRGVRPENIVWIFCTSRSGSTWLRGMMQELLPHKLWEEPRVGQLFGNFYHQAQAGQLGSANFVLGDPTREGWIRSIRNFVLDGAHYVHPFMRSGQYLLVKEPDGSIGAPLIMEALPESRMVFLVRDPRDVAASALDAARRGSWMYEALDRARWKEEALADRRPEDFVRARAEAYLRHVGGARAAYEAHRGPKALVRYEDLKADTLGTMKRLFSDLGIPVDAGDLARAVRGHSWENISESDKGQGKFYRKASPGSWSDDLSPGQARIVEEITAPLIEEFYPRAAPGSAGRVWAPDH